MVVGYTALLWPYLVGTSSFSPKSPGSMEYIHFCFCLDCPISLGICIPFQNQCLLTFLSESDKTHIRKDLGMPDLNGSDEKLKLILGSKTKGKKQSELMVR